MDDGISMAYMLMGITNFLGLRFGMEKWEAQVKMDAAGIFYPLLVFCKTLCYD